MSIEQVAIPATSRRPPNPRPSRAVGCRRVGSSSSVRSSSSTSSRSSSCRRSRRTASRVTRAPSRSASSRAPSSSRRPDVIWHPAGSTPPRRRAADRLLAEHQQHDLHDVDRDGGGPRGLGPAGPRLQAHPGPRPEPLRMVLRVPRATSGSASPASPAKPYIPLFAAFFLLILFCNWSGPHPAGRPGRVPARADERRERDPRPRPGELHLLRIRGLPQARRSAATPASSSRSTSSRTASRAGGIALFVGLVELMLEFVKPITLSMRLFGNIYGGEVALGVITALTIAFVPGRPAAASRSCSTRSRPSSSAS